jgi:hypothetical protein
MCKNTHTHDLETELTTQVFLRTGRSFIFHVIVAERHQETNEYFAGTCNDAATRRTKHGTLEKTHKSQPFQNRIGKQERDVAPARSSTTRLILRVPAFKHASPAERSVLVLLNCPLQLSLSKSIIPSAHSDKASLSRLSRTNNQLPVASSCFQSLGWLPRCRSNSHRHPSFQSTSHSSFRRNVTGK